MHSAGFFLLSSLLSWALYLYLAHCRTVREDDHTLTGRNERNPGSLPDRKAPFFISKEIDMALASRIIDENIDRPVARRTGGEIMCDALVHEGVRFVFGYPGGAIMPFYDALYGCPDLHHVLVRHDQAAAHAPQGFARAPG